MLTWGLIVFVGLWLVLLDGEYSASLDGVTLGGERVVEIKCTYKGRASVLWQAVETGELPEHDRWQVQHQLMATQAELADVFCSPAATASSSRLAPSVRLGRLYTRSGMRSHRCCRSRSHRRSPNAMFVCATMWNDSARRPRTLNFGRAMTRSGSSTVQYDEAKARLVAMAMHPKEQGGGVVVARLFERGTSSTTECPS